MPTPTFHETHGAMFLGLVVAVFLQGMLTVQLYHYYRTFPNDPRFNRILVAVTWVLDVIHVVLIAQTTYYYLISNWGNKDVLMFSTVALNLHLPLIGLTTLLCQTYFIHRIYVLTSRNFLITSLISIVCVVVFVLDLVISVRILKNLSVETFSAEPLVTAGQFILSAICDVMIATVLTFYLRRGKGDFEKTNNLITMLIRSTIVTGTVPALLAVLCAVVYLVKPHTFIFIAMHFSLGRIYSNALLATLNSRKALRVHFDVALSTRSAFAVHGGRHTFMDEEGVAKHAGIHVTKVQVTTSDCDLGSTPTPPSP